MSETETIEWKSRKPYGDPLLEKLALLIEVFTSRMVQALTMSNSQEALADAASHATHKIWTAKEECCASANEDSWDTAVQIYSQWLATLDTMGIKQP